MAMKSLSINDLENVVGGLLIVFAKSNAVYITSGYIEVIVPMSHYNYLKKTFGDNYAASANSFLGGKGVSHFYEKYDSLDAFKNTLKPNVKYNIVDVTGVSIA